MKANPRFVSQSLQFWAHAKLISEQVGYSLRSTKQLRNYSAEEAQEALRIRKLTADPKLLNDVIEYLN